MLAAFFRDKPNPLGQIGLVFINRRICANTQPYIQPIRLKCHQIMGHANHGVHLFERIAKGRDVIKDHTDCVTLSLV